MVARISFPKNVRVALNYHEQKVQKKQAECIDVGNYLMDPHEMDFHGKLLLFTRRNELNERARSKTVHVSLNFHPSEQIPDGRLVAIASAYMEKIGYGEQPYLVYKHHDAGHPHIHVLGTTIRENGQAISMAGRPRTLSLQALGEIEDQFGLMKAKRQDRVQDSTPGQAQRILYGQTETKAALLRAVNEVFHSYRFSSFEEYNAALRQFNVTASRGRTGGVIFRNRGLVYQVLNEKGQPTGVPIKASDLASRPVLQAVEQKFPANEQWKMPFRNLVAKAIDEALSIAGADPASLILALKDKSIYAFPGKGEADAPQNIFFVDNRNKLVFAGATLGENYTIPGLKERMDGQEIRETALSPVPSLSAMERQTGVKIPIENNSPAEDSLDLERPLLIKNARKKKEEKRKLPAGH